MATCMYVVAFVRAISFDNMEDINKVTNAINQNVFLSAFSMSSTRSPVKLLITLYISGGESLQPPTQKEALFTSMKKLRHRFVDGGCRQNKMEHSRLSGNFETLSLKFS